MEPMEASSRVFLNRFPIAFFFVSVFFEAMSFPIVGVLSPVRVWRLFLPLQERHGLFQAYRRVAEEERCRLSFKWAFVQLKRVLGR